MATEALTFPMPTDDEIAALGMGHLDYTAVRFCVAVIPRLRSLTPEARMRALHCCSNYSLHEPLQYHHKRDLKVPDFDEKERFHGAHIIYLMAMGIFVQFSEDEERAGAIVELFPEVGAASRLFAGVVEKVRAALEEKERERVKEEAPLFACLTEEKAA